MLARLQTTFRAFETRFRQRVSRRNRILLLAAGLASLGILSLVEQMGPRWREDGVAWRSSNTGIVADFVATDSPAALAGIRAGDLLVAIGDRRISVVEEIAVELSRAADANTDVEYRVTRDGVLTSHHLHPTTLPAGDRRSYSYLALMGFFCLGLGTLVAMRRPGEPLRLHFASLCALFFVVYAISPTGRLDALDWGLMLLDAAGIALLPPCFLQFCLKLAKKSDGARTWRVYGAAGAFLALQLFGFVASGSIPVAEKIVGWTDRLGPMYFSVFFVAGFVVLWRTSSSVRAGLERRRMRSLALGTAAGIAPFVAFYAVPLAIGRPHGVVPALFGFIPLALLPLSLAYAIIQNLSLIHI